MGNCKQSDDWIPAYDCGNDADLIVLVECSTHTKTYRTLSNPIGSEWLMSTLLTPANQLLQHATTDVFHIRRLGGIFRRDRDGLLG